MYCSHCGQLNEPQARFCQACGRALQPDVQASVPVSLGGYAGFWRRFGAAFIDGLILNIANYALFFLFLGVAGYDIVMEEEADTWALLYILWMLTSWIIAWLYYAGMESSSKQATLGKMAVSIVVTGAEGNRVSFARATGRYFGKFISAIILCIGYLMIAFTEKKQGLHDIMADCLVMVKR
ncbi:MAG: hypothetical protein DRI39_05870 [Chloroflexi bacterium]|nr:MAG: hypothetical protein DRI39_05870 [Chloroflexota bacterium]